MKTQLLTRECARQVKAIAGQAAQDLPKVRQDVRDREFIFVDELADACSLLMGAYNDREPVNLRGGADLSIEELAAMIKEVVGYKSELRFDVTKPDGMPLKVCDCSKLRAMGWWAKTSMQSALSATYAWFLRSEREG